MHVLNETVAEELNRFYSFSFWIIDLCDERESADSVKTFFAVLNMLDFKITSVEAVLIYNTHEMDASSALNYITVESGRGKEHWNLLLWCVSSTDFIGTFFLSGNSENCEHSFQ